MAAKPPVNPGKASARDARPAKNAPKPILKKVVPEPQEEEEDDDEDGMDIDLDEDDDFSDDEEPVFDDEEEEEEEETATSNTKIDKVTKKQLAEDDAEIAHLEKMLGLKGRKSLPKSFMEDGLGDLLGEIDEVVDDQKSEKRKRKAEADEWLAQKRRKAAEQTAQASKATSHGLDESEDGLEDSEMEDDSDLEDGLDGLLGEGSDEDGDDTEGDGSDGGSGQDDDFGGFDSDDEDDDEAESKPVERVRENPYVAPTTAQATPKYVPPSLRKATGSEAELAARIRRQTQGLINRITESNLLGIVGDIEKLYRENPRQHVSSSLIDLLLTQVSEPTSLPDTLLILIAGFSTAVYKVMGMDIGAQLVQQTIERFDGHYEEARVASLERPDVSKHTSNLITFIAELYNFQLIGPNLLFDYIRFLLDDLSELNAELLLRIIRMSGPSLRQDDPMALKDIVSLIRPAVAKIGEQNLSVRTKFMIETINDLKNNKMKTGAVASAVVSEHVTRMKKLLGTLNSRKLKATESLRIGLKDIRDSDKKGKWWLVGASWAGPSAEDKLAKKQAAKEQDGDDHDDESLLLDSEDEGMPDLAELAREQGMNTDVRRSIFISILSATDYEDAYYRVLKLRLNKERQREIPNVIVQCSGAEQHYNPYYTLIAKKFCGDRKIRWAFQDSLWRMFRRLGESVFGEDADEDDEDEAIDMRRVVNVAKLYGTMIASGHLSLTILKCLNLPYLQAKTKAFVEVLLITVLQECLNKKAESGDGEGDAAIRKVFGAVEEVPDLTTGLLWFIKKVVRKTDLAGGKGGSKMVKEGCKIVEKALQDSRQGLGD